MVGDVRHALLQMDEEGPDAEDRVRLGGFNTREAAPVHAAGSYEWRAEAVNRFEDGKAQTEK
jgi:hypothetical protein